ncbi:hypothetical protein GCM10027089_55260 [Nocardia thraciensis]
MTPHHVSQWQVEQVTQWAIVTLGRGCGRHDGPCPLGWWGPYSRAEAEEAIRFVASGHIAHLVPVMTNRNQRRPTTPAELPQRTEA